MIRAVRWRMFRARAAAADIRADDYGDAWPFTTDAVTLCAYSTAVWVERYGFVFPLNGMAHSLLPKRGAKLSPLEDIWRVNDAQLDQLRRAFPDDHARISTPRIDIGPMIAEGLALADPNERG